MTTDQLIRTTATRSPELVAQRPRLRAVGRLFGDVIVPGAVKAAMWAWVTFNLALLAWIVMTSFKSTGAILKGPFAPPTSLEFSNYSLAWTTAGFGQAMLATLAFVAGTLVITLGVAVPAAYALARRSGRANSVLIAYFAAGLALPMQTVLIPFFVMNSAFGQFMVDWVTGVWDPRIGLVVLYSATAVPWAVFVLTAYFRSLPKELEEAARLDGASAWLTFRKVMLPVARGPVTTISVITAIGAWNETLLVLVLVPDGAKRTLPAALLNMYYSMQYTSNWGALFAGVVILMGPIVIAFLWFGRRIIEGATLGVSK